MTRFAVAFLFTLTAASVPSRADDETSSREDTQVDLTTLSLEELMELEVTSVSRREEPFFEAAAAVYVLTGDDLRRAGATTLADALRLVPGMQVAHVNASQWAISARGFNNQFANKLLVLIDGRTVYTPLFAGVYWDVQDVVLEDVERIEVIRGPGATLWGANAVNGVVNVTTRSADATLGSLFAAGGGSEERAFVTARQTSRVGENAALRFDAKYVERAAFVDERGERAHDSWDTARGGFRLDWDPRPIDRVMLQGALYTGTRGQSVPLSLSVPPFAAIFDTSAAVAGGHLLGRWEHAFTPGSRAALQMYFDRTERSGAFLGEERSTFDVDLQHDLTWGARQRLVYGVGYRVTHDAVRNTFVVELTPRLRTDHLWSGFVQNEITLVPDRLRLTLGTKLEHNDYTGFEAQPSARLAWIPNRTHAGWAAVSRAVRTPSRVESDVRFVLGAFTLRDTLNVVALTGNPDLQSDELLAYELGYRVHPTPTVLLDVAAFYNDYDMLGTFEPEPAFFESTPRGERLVRPQRIDNLGSGETYGVEVAATWEPLSRLQLAFGYAWFEMRLRRDAASSDTADDVAEGNDPEQQVHARFDLDVVGSLSLHGVATYVDALPGQDIPDYTRLDLRMAWRPINGVELSVTGRNLLESRHREFGRAVTSALPTEVPRGVYGKVVWRY